MKLVQVTNTWCLGGAPMCALAICKALPDWQHEIIARVHPSPTPDPPPHGRLYFYCGCPPLPSDADAVILHDVPDCVMPLKPLAPTIMFHHFRSTRRTPADVDAYPSEWARNGLPGVTIYQSVDYIPSRSYSGRFVVGFLATPSDRRKWDAIGPLLARLPGEREIVGGEAPGARTLPPHQHAARVYLPQWSVLVYHSPVTESFGRVVVEAMAAGCVPVADRRGGIRETVVDGVTGFLCGGPSQFVERVEQLHADRAMWKRMSDAAMAHARERFSHERFGSELRRLIASVS